MEGKGLDLRAAPLGLLTSQLPPWEARTSLCMRKTSCHPQTPLTQRHQARPLSENVKPGGLGPQGTEAEVEGGREGGGGKMGHSAGLGFSGTSQSGTWEGVDNPGALGDQDERPGSRKA